MKDLLLEIGVEELPARFVGPALAALETATRDRLTAAGLAPASLRGLGTPRRLAVLAEGVPNASADRVEEALGPGLAQAKTPDGAWSPAALGFAKSQGVAPEALEVRLTDRGPRLARTRRVPGSPADRVLLDVLPAIVGGLAFPKTMVWEPTRFAFARPLRWIVALLGAKPLVFSVAGVKACKLLGLKRIAVLTPYLDEVNEPIRQFIDKYGVAVGAFGSFKLSTEPEIASVLPETILAASKALDAPDIDGIFVSCTGMRGHRALDALEQATGKPCLSSNQAQVWDALGLIGCDKPIHGFGSMLARTTVAARHAAE